MILLATDPQTIISNLEGLVAAALVLVVGVLVLHKLARMNIFAIITLIALAGLAFLLIKGTLIQDVSGWWTSVGL